MSVYTALTFAPVQGFIEKSRKLRDLFGASMILSYLSYVVVEKARHTEGVIEIISPGCPHLQKGMPNRILLKGNFSIENYQEILLSTWQTVLEVCRSWVEENLSEFQPYNWEKEWKHWGNHSWEIFWGQGNSIPAAMKDLETNKLARGWIGVNWIGESSSLTGTDAIAWHGLGGERRNPKFIDYRDEKDKIEKFYKQLAWVLDGRKAEEEEQPEGKYIAPNEKLSILELVKRLVTLPEISKKLKLKGLQKGFKDIIRRKEDGREGQWTGWFMGDGDKVGNYLKKLALEDNGDQKIKQFSDAMRTWGKNFSEQFPKELGRVIYAGGDDFLGVIYNQDSSNKSLQSINGLTVLDWLIKLPENWKQHQQKINLSLGFVWAAPNVPQRDVLQHCRETQAHSKSLGRNRVTIRVVFNNGQYVQWSCPWDKLQLLKQYEDRDGNNYQSLDSQNSDQKPNWSHVYNDLAQLKARHAIELNPMPEYANSKLALALFNLYFNNQDQQNNQDWETIVGGDYDQDIINWINDLIHVGWQLCSDT